eukprot:6472018-Amphidinium_carterae.3
MLRVTNTTTFDEVHGWISNCFNSIYIGIDEEQTIGGIDDNPKKPPYKPWWNNRWSKGKGKRQKEKDTKARTKTKAKEKAKTKDEAIPPSATS